MERRRRKLVLVDDASYITLQIKKIRKANHTKLQQNIRALKMSMGKYGQSSQPLTFPILLSIGDYTFGVQSKVFSVRLTPYSVYSASFFSRNSVFLSQQFSRNSVFQPVSTKFQTSERGLRKVYFVRLKIAIIDCRQTKCCFTLPPVILASNQKINLEKLPLSGAFGLGCLNV